MSFAQACGACRRPKQSIIRPFSDIVCRSYPQRIGTVEAFFNGDGARYHRSRRSASVDLDEVGLVWYSNR
ncbi:unnamed protein product [Alternaria burnsii]|nr:unnamed protein product [Alternaria burnsii]